MIWIPGMLTEPLVQWGPRKKGWPQIKQQWTRQGTFKCKQMRCSEHYRTSRRKVPVNGRPDLTQATNWAWRIIRVYGEETSEGQGACSSLDDVKRGPRGWDPRVGVSSCTVIHSVLTGLLLFWQGRLCTPNFPFSFGCERLQNQKLRSANHRINVFAFSSLNPWCLASYFYVTYLVMIIIVFIFQCFHFFLSPFFFLNRPFSLNKGML